MKIDIFDTTLRDGFQQEGISPSVKDKLEIAKLLDNQNLILLMQNLLALDQQENLV